MIASKHKLSNLCLIIDYNKIQSYGKTSEVLELEPLSDKLKSFGYNILEADGHNIKQIKSCLNNFKKYHEKPSAIICHTIKGKGLPFAEHNPVWHHKSNLKKSDYDKIYSSL